MLNNSEIVQSAASSFNNMALFAPDFFWVSLLCLPIFAVFWIFGNQIAENILPDNKKRLNTVFAGTIIIITLWLLTHGSYAALRDVSLMPTIIAASLFICFVFITRLCDKHDIRLSKYIKAKKSWAKIIDFTAPILIAAGVGLCGEPGLQGFILQAGAAMFGMIIGYVLNKLKKAEYSADFVSIFLMGVISFCLLLQPEFFRFGQLGRLTSLHMIFICMTQATIIAGLVLRFFKPRGWFSESLFKKIKLVSTLFVLLCACLFLFTESALSFGAFMVMFAIAVLLNTLHQKKDSAAELSKISTDMFILSTGLFGIITTLPVLTCASILLWRAIRRDKKIKIFSKK